MKKFLVALMIALSPFLALAKIVGKSTGESGSVLLTDEKCAKDLEKGFKLIVINHKAEKLDEGCWLKHEGVVYFVSDILGNGGVPEDAFDWFVKDSTRSPNT